MVDSNYHLVEASQSGKPEKFAWLKRLGQLFRKIIRLIGPANFFLAVILILGVIVLVNVKTKTNLSSKAVAGKAVVFFTPTSISIPLERKVQVFLTSENPIGFVRLELRFDASKFSLLEPPKLTLPGFSEIIKTTVEEANTKGSVVFVAGLEPSKRGNPPRGSFQIGELLFANKSLAAAEGNLVVSVAGSQVVDIDGFSLNIESVNAKLQYVAPAATVTAIASSLAGTPTPFPTPTPTPFKTPPTSTPSPTREPLYQSPVATSVSTLAPTATAISGGTGTGAASPQITINLPHDYIQISWKSVLFVSAKVSGSDRLANINLYWDGRIKKSCDQSRRCAFWLFGWFVSRGTHIISAELVDPDSGEVLASDSVFVSR